MIDKFANAPVSELQKILGLAPRKRYNHMGICSGDYNKPIGSPGCICLRALKNDPLGERY